MIHYLVTHAHRYTIERYLASRSWDPALALDRRIQVVPYHTLPGRSELARGAYIFSDLERLTDTERDVATQAWEQLASASGGRSAVRLFNHPRRALRRYDLLRTLHEAGINEFRAYRLGELQNPRFPVFLRYEDRHAGSITPLLRTPEELERAVDRVLVEEPEAGQILAVEFCDTADAAGIYRKYSAFLVGDRVLPRHVFFDRQWTVKDFAVIDDAKAREQLEYLESNPHEAWIRDVFRLAQIDYGRIDYGLLNGRPQAWEINTNPNIMPSLNYYPARHRAAPRYFAPRIAAAFDEIERSVDSGPPIPVTIRGHVPPPARPGPGWLARRARWAARRQMKRLRHWVYR